MLEEKERKKKQLAEEKEWRKKVREENRRKKEENMKLKAEEQARKLAEKARKSKRVQATKENQENQTLPVKKNIKSTVINNNDTTYACNINGDQCCMCLGSYAEDVREGNGREWLMCSCGRWLHEDCISGAVDLSEDTELCPFCLLHL